MKKIVPIFIFTNKQYEDIKHNLTINHVPNIKTMWLKNHIIIYKE